MQRDHAITEEPVTSHERVSTDLERRLRQTLASINTQTENTSVVFAARDTMGNLVGGVCGATSYGWLLVKILWVGEAQRRTGIGTALLQEAEAKARQSGCHGAWLDTSNAEARAFYLRHGYREFGALENGPGQRPAAHKRWFLRKSLQDASGYSSSVQAG